MSKGAFTSFAHATLEQAGILRYYSDSMTGNSRRMVGS